MNGLKTWLLGQPGNLRGILWVALSTLLFAALNVGTLYPAQHLNPWMMAFLRYAFGLTIFLAIIPISRQRYTLRTGKLWLHAVRGAVHSMGMVLWFTALPHVHLADITAFSFTGPLFVTIGAALFLGEAVRTGRWMAVAIGFSGAMIILRPGLQELSLFALSALASAPFFAASNLIAKQLSRADSAGTIVLWQSIWIPIFTLPMALANWQSPEFGDYGWFVLVGLAGTLGHLAMQRGYQVAEITALQPIGFLALVWNALLGLVLFAQQPDLWTFVGAAVIFASATVFSRGELRAPARALGG